MTVTSPIRVFVYGTLKRGEPNASVMTGSEGYQRFVGVGRTKLSFPLIIASKYNIPFVLNEPGKGYQVEGEVYEIDDTKLKALDVLEAYPTLYWRQLEPILLDNNTEVSAWIYLMRKWRRDIYDSATSMMSSYSSKGTHGREYVSRSVLFVNSECLSNLSQKVSARKPISTEKNAADPSTYLECVDEFTQFWTLVKQLRSKFVGYIRAKDMLDDPDYNLHADIQGGDAEDPITKAASHAKAVNDAKSQPF